MTEQPTLPVAGFRTPFIPAWLDDFGFTPVEFRVVCRVLRRQDGFTGGDSCWQSYPIMAGELRMHRDTLQATIRRLIEWGVLARQQRSGKTSLLRLAPPENWTRPSPLNQPALKTTGVNIGRTPPGNEGGHPPESKGYEGSPLKVLPKGSPKDGRKRPSVEDVIAQIGYPHQGAELEKLWTAWIEHRLQLKKANWLSLFAQQQKQLAAEPAEVFKAAVSESLLNGWQGMFPDKFKKGPNASHSHTARISSDRNRFISGANSPECRAENAAHIARTKEENRYGPGEGPAVPAERASV